MNYKLTLDQRVLNRDDAIYHSGELKKAQETIRELFKEKTKYKDKIKVLSNHIKHLRNKSKIYAPIIGVLSRANNPKIISSLGPIKLEELHETLTEEKQRMVKKIRKQREEQKEKFPEGRYLGKKHYQLWGMRKKGPKGLGTGYVFTKSGVILELLQSKKIKQIENAKLPFNKTNHIGVEIEFASFLSQEQIGQFFFDEGLINHVQLHHEYIDAKDPNEKEYELCVVAPEEKIFDIIERVCVILNEKVDANITRGCGLHVHIDARNRNIRTVFDNLFNCQEILYDMVAYTRRSNKHVQIMNKKVWYPGQSGFAHQKECKEELCVCPYDKGNAYRFYGLNTWAYKSHTTMEVRIHSGTANATKINNWIKLLINIADGKKVPNYIKNLDQFKTAVKLDDKLLEYVTKRIENFKRTNV